MDTSLSKALIMVAGLLLAMIVIAFVTFSFRKMGTWATASDDQLLSEQKDKFNKEYEVYDKSLMYGVDVISCLNKVLSNNEKITNGSVVNGEKYDESYEVKVKVTIKENKPLQESIDVYYMSNNKELAYQTGGPNDVFLENVEFSFIKNNTKYLTDISKFKANDSLEKRNESCKKLATEFNLTKDGNGEGETDLRALLSVSNALSEVKKNPDKSSASKSDGWTKAEFKSALYDLKTRKFKCASLTYSEAGRVNYIEFKEI